ncbi:MAG: hypothetical protein HY662_00695 [Chloroflexi bacterium]|nr:hypothetical protein [Chloroflexota bacterium]
MSELFPAKTIGVEVLACTDASREFEFNRWYTKVHIPDLKQTPGIENVSLYRELVLKFGELGARWEPLPGEPGRYLTLYRININADDPWALMQRVKEDDSNRIGQSKMIDCMKTYNINVWDFITYRRTVQPLLRPETHLPDGMPEAFFTVFHHPDPAWKDEFNDWYLYTHLHDLLETPGCVQCSRFRNLNPKPAEHEASILAIYEIDSDDPVAVFRRILEDDRDMRRPSGRMGSFPRLPMDTYGNALYQHVDF